MTGALELVAFDLGGARFAAALAQVRRIDQPLAALDVGQPLGRPRAGRRALVFSPAPGLERALAVDQVHGVRQVPPAALRRLPPLARAPRLVLGAWLDGAAVVLLIDLHATWNPSPGDADG